MAIPSKTNEPLRVGRISLTFDNKEIVFSELVGITTEVEPVEYLETGVTGGTTGLMKLPGKTKPATLVLKRGKNSSMELWAWHELVLRGDLGRANRSCVLTMHGPDGTPVAQYQLEHAWPSKLEIGALKAGSSEVLMETVTIVCERIQRVSV